MPLPAPLLAADWIQIAIFLFIIFSSLAGQLFKVNQERRRKGNVGRPPAEPPQQPRPGRPAAPGKPDRPRGPLQKEIEDFLRRALGDQPEPDAEPEVVAEVVQRGPHERSPVPLAVSRAREEAPEHESVAEHVARRMRSERVEEHSSGPRGSIEHADERMEDRLGKVFDHSLGQLTRSDKDLAGKGISAGTDASVWETQSRTREVISPERLAEMLRSPDDLAAAVVLSEILRSPVDRWS